MTKNNDGLIMILDFIEKYWASILGIFFLFLSFMIFNTVYEVKYLKPNYKVQKIAVIEKLTNIF
jgi:hypothetical protein|uniref:Uncharacterized protein n=1 Tax=viral metagenome TaxID=1070528 RepID=A0A6C0BYX6_9ZZZZ